MFMLMRTHGIQPTIFMKPMLPTMSRFSFIWNPLNPIWLKWNLVTHKREHFVCFLFEFTQIRVQLTVWQKRNQNKKKKFVMDTHRVWTQNEIVAVQGGRTESVFQSIYRIFLNIHHFKRFETFVCSNVQAILRIIQSTIFG
jgi:hypothetical protein